jgi:hypothetical protein
MMFGLGISCPGDPGCPGGTANPGAPAVDTTAADFQALQASAAQGGVDTPQGSYSVDPTTGAVTFIPVAPSSSLFPGISNTALVMGAGAFVVFLALSGGGRR